LEAIAFAFFGVMTLVVTSGRLENIVHAKGPNDAWVFLVAELLRWIGIKLAVKKYR
jgi:hypothetical protein